MAVGSRRVCDVCVMRVRGGTPSRHLARGERTCCLSVRPYVETDRHRATRTHAPLLPLTRAHTHQHQRRGEREIREFLAEECFISNSRFAESRPQPQPQPKKVHKYIPLYLSERSSLDGLRGLYRGAAVGIKVPPTRHLQLYQWPHTYAKRIKRCVWQNKDNNLPRDAKIEPNRNLVSASTQNSQDTKVL